MKPFTLLAAAAVSSLLVFAPAAAQTEVVIAEPNHSMGYLPLYVAIRNGYFEEEGLTASVMTVEGGAHTTAVLTGQAFAFIGGPEHNAFAKVRGGELRAVVNVVNRGNVYLVTREGAEGPGDEDLAAFFSGKTIAVAVYGNTPNSVLRYILDQNGLDPQSDVVLSEMANAGIMAALGAGTADIGVMNEPNLTRGITEGRWNEPFYNVPNELGPYAYSTLNIRQSSIEDDPETVRGFVRAVARGLKFTHENPEEAAAIARLEFPTQSEEDLMATLNRAFADNLWSEDGSITPESWETGKAVVMGAGILEQDVAFEEIIDMSFFEEILPTL